MTGTTMYSTEHCCANAETSMAKWVFSRSMTHSNSLIGPDTVSGLSSNSAWGEASDMLHVASASLRAVSEGRWS